MAEEQKKISFGFTKINKKAVLTLPKKEEKKIEFIACLEEKSIKLLNAEETVKELPVIPLINGNLLRDNMIEALKMRNEKKKHVPGSHNNLRPEDPKDEEIKPQDPKDEEIKPQDPKDEETKPLTLDELAAKEILDDLKKVNETEEIQETLTIPKAEAVKVSEKESTLEDYDSMPVNQFGLAVLRGMGWKPDKGIGKNAKIVEPINPILRPKGMGLGADKVVQTSKTEFKEELFMKKGAFLKVVSGHNIGLYGKVEGFDDLPGRIIVRLTLRNDVISINENLVALVTSSEYNKNSKILNLKEYNDFVVDKPVSSSSKFKEKILQRDYRKEDSSSEDEIKYKNRDSYINGSRKKLGDFSEVTHRQYKSSRKHNSSESDSARRKKHKNYSNKAKKSTRYDDVSADSESSDSASSEDRKKSKSKKHRKHNSKHRTRSRSKTQKRKKKRYHRSRS